MIELNFDEMEQFKDLANKINIVGTTYYKNQNLSDELLKVAPYVKDWEIDSNNYRRKPWALEKLFNIFENLACVDSSTTNIYELSKAPTEGYKDIMDLIISLLLRKDRFIGNPYNFIDKITTDDQFILRDISKTIIKYHNTKDAEVLNDFCKRHSDNEYYIYRLRQCLKILLAPKREGFYNSQEIIIPIEPTRFDKQSNY